MNVFIFVAAVILSVIGLSAIMNRVVEKMMTVQVKTVKLAFANEQNFDMVSKSFAGDKDEVAVLCCNGLSAVQEEICKEICLKRNVIYCDNSTFAGVMNVLREEYF